MTFDTVKMTSMPSAVVRVRDDDVCDDVAAHNAIVLSLNGCSLSCASQRLDEATTILTAPYKTVL